MGYKKRLDRAFDGVPILPMCQGSKYVLFSDCHRGNGTNNDNFLKNQHLYMAALRYYAKNRYTYIELGDGDELWENRKMEQIEEVHGEVFELLHEAVYHAAFPGITFYSGLILENPDSGKRLYLTHGHQASLLNSTFWPVSRFLVRYVWKPLELVGVLDPTSAAKNYIMKQRAEKKLVEWAKENERVLITGHTHRPMVTQDACGYMNTGSCVHPYLITCIEVENDILTLVKWYMDAGTNGNLFVERSPIL